MEKLLGNINSPKDIRGLSLPELAVLASEIRRCILDTVSETGGHLASSLGAVELTIAAHYVFNTPDDKILWDVGHQAYTHKILTGRAKKFSTLRQLGGLSGFPNKYESPEYDIFTTGHSSTAISAALGLAAARDLKNEKNKVIAIVGDAALAGGMSFEALNHAGQTKKDIIVILNDNELSISQSVGALSRYLNRIITNPAYNKIRNDVERVLKRIPRFGFRAYRAARKLEEGLKNLLVPGMLFEELGFRYFGPIDGHNIAGLVSTMKNIVGLNEPILLHVVTKKGKGYDFAETDPASFHGTGAFDLDTGRKTGSDGAVTFTRAFGEKILQLARKDPRVVAVTAAMLDGTGLDKFAALVPERFFDVGIAEEHAVTFAAGLARNGLKPVVAIYSTFLQRGYDQMIHDVCLQNLPVVFCLDRAGLVGEDGPTHHGVFDIAFLRHMPNMTIMAPATPEELAMMLEFALGLNGPVAIRYPKAKVKDTGVPASPIEAGKAHVLREGKDLAIIALGNMTGLALEVAALLSKKKKISVLVANARFAKPIDGSLIMKICGSIKNIVTIEEGVLEGGFGSAVLEFIERENIRGITVRRIGLPDIFIEHGPRSALFAKYNLTADGVCDVIIGEVL